MPRLTLQTGMATQWIDLSLNTIFGSAEWTANRYHHLGIQYVMYMPSYLNYSYFNYTTNAWLQGPLLERKSYEVGILYKFFFHGRLTGRKSSIYVGPDIRFGKRQYLEENILDPAGNTYFQGQTVKVMFRLGTQLHIGKAVLELSLPLGIETEKNNRSSFIVNSNYEDLNGKRFVLLPSLSLGYSFFYKK